MKKIGLQTIIILIMIQISLLSQPTDLFFTEYVEGSSNNKVLEIYNGTGSTIDLSAGGYKIEIYFNGSSTATTSINLTGSISNEDVYVIADNDAAQVILDVADQTSTAAFFNGNDAIILKKGSTILDVIGQVGVDPGTEWGSGLTSTADNTLRRKAGTTAGDANPNDTFDPSIQWDGYAQDTFSGLGSPAPVPVELSSFTLTVRNNIINLQWETKTEINNYGFDIERSSTTTVQGWEKIGFVNGHGNSNSPKYYSYKDKSATGGKFIYRLKQIDTDGKYEFSKEVEVDLGLPKNYALEQNYPNPFNPATRITYTLPVESNVQLAIFNVEGELVKSIVNEKQSAGVYTINFDASELASGTYIYKLLANNFIQLKKMLLIK